MLQRLRPSVAVAILAACPGGCGRSVQPGPVATHVSVDAYEQVLDAAVAVLRDRRFVIDRQDRRFGVLTTRPRSASTWMDYQRTDHGNAESRNHATLNHHRRRVRVELRPQQVGDGPPGHYALSVNVSVQRRQLPTTGLNTAAMTALRPVAAREVGAGAFWRPLGRDPDLEQVLLRAIAQRAGLVPGADDES